ncbi:MAG: 50S ribosomal protein L24 [Elusimicrobiota bacterium]
MLKIKKKDNVIVTAGKDKGKQGEVIKVFEKTKRVLVSKINIIKKHARASQSNPGGVMEKEAAVHISNLQIVCSKCSQPTRIRFDKLEDGEKVRVCKKCGEMLI